MKPMATKHPHQRDIFVTDDVQPISSQQDLVSLSRLRLPLLISLLVSALLIAAATA